MGNSIESQVALVTGAAQGLGFAIAARLHGAGYRVVLSDRSLDAAQSAARDLDASGATVMPLALDVVRKADFEAALAAVEARWGGIQVLVNNAANDMRYDAMKITPEVWDDSQAVNFKAYFFACQKAAELMTDKGSIINFSSITYIMGAAGMVPYVSANAGITGMTRALAREWGPKGIRVNAIAPGWVFTEKQETMWATPEAKAAFLEKQCLKDFMRPGDMVGGTLFLASAASAMMTGQVMVIDAGVVHAG